MDFLSASLKEEIEKKRKLLDKAQGNDTKSKKFVRRADLEKIREQEYMEEQAKLEQKRQEKLQERLGQIQDAKEESEKNASNKEDPVVEILNTPSDEVIRRLRAKGEPIRLFGETDKQRNIRLRTLELMEERSEGQRNDFMKTLEAMEAGLDLENLKKQAGEVDNHEKKKRKDDSARAVDTTQISLEMLSSEPEKVYGIIYTYFKRLLREWEYDLNDRPEHVKRSTQGKHASATQKQTAEYLSPFFKLLKRKELEKDVLARITEIVQRMQQREYLQANDSYLRLSIGNSPWPIGVTMVGIHERSAREKIFSNQVAHVLNDETQRKWIQSIKRLMTFCQSKYPPDDLSKMIG
ncbi:Prp18-domain-containing protein [Basidiobolus meristosporus CBS 931.73]|uniref:Pre-mRNA-splicing factor 18 n=1 Tax=Basidiobolus meristosporus CBS 931.73 TaxID=1314790 RepID=A0A1Y1XVT8_9FUNG|nr:Prp18-domain-containing protein [Basidiobolus meristosporus CBS 931.73]|eukprot:ORX89596.1 Prp18-domain-containing protein [Basidiobolus meristosporus CBS 931.73]